MRAYNIFMKNHNISLLILLISCELNCAKLFKCLLIGKRLTNILLMRTVPWQQSDSVSYDHVYESHSLSNNYDMISYDSYNQ